MSSGSIELPHGRSLNFERPRVMGVVNVTPDSFSDGGLYFDASAAAAHAGRLAAEGADILDVGGESTRPGHEPIDEVEERRRVLPVVGALAKGSTVLSIDTTKARVAAAAIAAGASIVNDVWGLRRDPDMGRVAAESGAFVILMHNRESVDDSIDIVSEALDFLSGSIDRALAAGVAANKIAVDPGFGFGKTHRQSLALVRDLPRLCALGFPVLLGVSRKRAIGHATGRGNPADRLAGSLACGLIGVERGALILRVHDVAAHVDAIAMREAILSAGGRT
jgi:dihydropteroate synthase